MMSDCTHDLAERETMVADGYCPACMSAYIERLTTEGEVMRKALERIANYNGNQRLTREADDMADIAREALVSRS